jgi:hypothetical protein
MPSGSRQLFEGIAPGTLSERLTASFEGGEQVTLHILVEG